LQEANDIVAERRDYYKSKIDAHKERYERLMAEKNTLSQSLDDANATIASKDDEIRKLKAELEARNTSTQVPTAAVENTPRPEQQQSNDNVEVTATIEASRRADEYTLSDQEDEAIRRRSDEKLARDEEKLRLQGKIKSFGNQENNTDNNLRLERNGPSVQCPSEEELDDLAMQKLNLIRNNTELIPTTESPEYSSVAGAFETALERQRVQAEETLKVVKDERDHALLQTKKLSTYVLALNGDNPNARFWWREPLVTSFTDKEPPLLALSDDLVESTRSLEALEKSKASLFTEVYRKTDIYNQDKRNYKSLIAVSDAKKRCRSNNRRVEEFADIVVRLESGRLRSLGCPPVNMSLQADISSICARISNLSIGSHCFEECRECQEVVKEEARLQNELRLAKTQRDSYDPHAYVRSYRTVVRDSLSASILHEAQDEADVVIISSSQAYESRTLCDPNPDIEITTPDYDWSSDRTPFIPPHVNGTAMSLAPEVLASLSASTHSPEAPAPTPARPVLPNEPKQASSGDVYTFRDRCKDSAYNGALILGAFATLKVGTHVAAKLGFDVK
jgi:hypothetical protein